jgi:hypothetical protein
MNNGKAEKLTLEMNEYSSAFTWNTKSHRRIKAVNEPSFCPVTKHQNDFEP